MEEEVSRLSVLNCGKCETRCFPRVGLAVNILQLHVSVALLLLIGAYFGSLLWYCNS